MTPRETAVRILLPVLTRSAHLGTVWPEIGPSLEPRDRSFVRRLVLGALRRLGELDYLIGRLSHQPLQRIDPEVLWILRCALYELLDSRTPRHAVVHEWAQLCRVLRKSSATAFVNGLLRQYLRRPVTLPSGMDPASLAIRFSHPEWLVRRYLDRHGLETARNLMSCNNSEPGHFLWVNPSGGTALEEVVRSLEEAGFPCDPVEDFPGCLKTAAAVAAHPLYERDFGTFIDVASQWVAHLPRVSDRRRVADLCAAPGGKAFVLASRLPGGQRLLAADGNPGRLDVMRERMRRLRLSNISLLVGDLRDSCFRPAVFDFILLDVPCSGLGTLSAHPEIRWRFQTEQFSRLQGLQLDLLRSAFDALSPGGELLYSTCSTEPEENEHVIAAFEKTEPAVRVLEPFQRTSPLSHGGQSLFAARLRRE